MMLSQKFFNCKQAQQKVNHCSKNKRKGEKGKAKKKSKNRKACPSHNALKRDAGDKKGKLLCCKHIFDWIKGNLAEIQPKDHQNVQKTHFLQKVPGVNGLSLLNNIMVDNYFDKKRTFLHVTANDPHMKAVHHLSFSAVCAIGRFKLHDF